MSSVRFRQAPPYILQASQQILQASQRILQALPDILVCGFYLCQIIMKIRLEPLGSAIYLFSKKFRVNLQKRVDCGLF